MTQQEFNEMLAVAIAGGLGGGTYISRWDGEEIDDAIARVRESGLAYLANGNLLINSDFRQPVNRNGKTEYTAAWQTIDCWRLYRPGTITLGSDGISITPNKTGLATFFIQQIGNLTSGIGRQMTLSFLLTDNAPAGEIGIMDSALNNLGRTYISAGDKLVTLTFTAPSRLDSAYIAATANDSQSPLIPVAAKLELGDQQTLAHQDEDGNWVLNDPPNYDLQYLLTSLYSPTTGEWVGIQHSNPNLLDNWYFVGGGSQQGGGQFPINQRGQTEYTGVGAKTYTIDRWYVESGCKIELQSDGLVFTPNPNSFCLFAQYVENYKDYIGKTITVSFLVDENTTDGSAVVWLYGGVSGAIAITSIVGTGVFSTTLTIPANIRSLRVAIQGQNTTGSLKLRAVKLELGPYQTLAHQDADGNWVLNDPPPKFGKELAECQRYQLVLVGPNETWKNLGCGAATSATKAYISIPIPVTMRANPEIEFGGTDWYLESGSEGVQVTAITKNVSAPSSVQVSVFTAGGLTVGKMYWLVKRSVVSSDTKLILNCNL